jgi:O-antigen ligase
MAMTLGRRPTGALALPLAGIDASRLPQAAVFLFFLGVVLPPALAVNVFDLALFPVRLVLLAFLIPAVIHLVRDKDAGLRTFDACVLAAMLWLLVALMANNGVDKGFKFGGSLLLEAVGGYLLARAYVRTQAQFVSATRIYFLFVLVAGAAALPEMLFGTQFAHDLAAAVTGTPKTVGSEPGRFGLSRAGASFEHPILYGVFCASALGLVWYLTPDRRRRLLRALAILAATLCALSSAPLLAYVLILAFIAWEHWTRRIAKRTAITLGLAASVYAVVELLSNRSAVEILIGVVALDHWTAYYRILIWQNAGRDVLDHPWLGVAIDAWTRPQWMTGSVDSFWLSLALIGGLPTVTLLGAGLLSMLLRVQARRGFSETPQRRSARLAWTATMLALTVQAFTVHYWGSMDAFFFFLLGMGAWMAESREGLVPAPGEADRQPAKPGVRARRGVLRAATAVRLPALTRRRPG